MIIAIKKRIKLLIFFIVFVIISPIVLLYANGDILGNGWTLLPTGGIYVVGALAGSNIYLNGKLKDETSFFNRDILIRSLKKGKYDISVKKEGYDSWVKKLTVSDNLVTDANIFMLPQKVELREILKYILPGSDISTSTLTKIKNQEYTDIAAIFAKQPSTPLKMTKGTSTIDFKSNLGTKRAPIMNGRIGLWKEGGKIFSEWFGSNDLAPKYFCKVEDCSKAILVMDVGEEPKRINYLPEYSGVALVAVYGDIFAIQIEENPEKVPQIIYIGSNPDFRVSNDILYIKDNQKLFEVIL